MKFFNIRLEKISYKITNIKKTGVSFLIKVTEYVKILKVVMCFDQVKLV